ncbi:MAG: P-loop NTPase [Methanosarcinaceae archaeon]|nr:P-loop NTPase [Methanosarcinaceae archaeon]
MKILVCGKGGSGKSTVTALLAKSVADKGCNVLVVDSDESNFGLHRQLGLELPDDFMNFLGGKKTLIEKMMAAMKSGEKTELFEENWSIADIPEPYVVTKGNISLVSVGKIHDFGEGCACPMGALARHFLKNIETGAKDFVFVDTEAGVEHFGRGVEEGCDLILMVLDPSYESIKLSEKVAELCDRAGKKLYFVFNKVNGDGRTAMLGAVEEERVLSIIPPNEELFQAGLEGREFEVILPEIEFIVSSLISGKAS